MTKHVDQKIRSIALRATFVVIAVAATALGLSRQLAATETVQDMRGQWNGFIAKMGDPPQSIHTEITSQTNRRFIGTASPPDPVQPISIEGIVSASGKVNYQGQSADGRRAVGKADLTDFGDGAAILNGHLTLSVNDGFIVPCVLELRPFAINPPDPVQPAGRYVGTLSGAGQIVLSLNNPPDPVRPTSFNGTVEIVVNGQTLNFLLLATANVDGRVIAIAHGTAGHLILDANLGSPPDPVQPITLNGNFALEFADGSELEGTFQTVATRTDPT
jgi:hypothetical protein